MLSNIPSLLLVLLLGATSHAFSVPWNTNQDPQYSTTHQPSEEQLRSVFPQLIWLRDTFIGKVFGVPPKPTSVVGIEKPYRVLHPSSPTAAQLSRYSGEVVLRFNLSTPFEEEQLAKAADTLFLDVWDFTHNWADIRLREDTVPYLLGLLPDSLQRAYSTLIPDLAKSIHQTYPAASAQAPAFPPSPRDRVRAFTPSLLKTSEGGDNIFFSRFQPYSVIVPWMRLMASMFDTHVRMINIGKTYEGRDISGLRIGVSPTLRQGQDEPEPRKTILISGGFHAREWISVSTVTYIAWSLITSYGKSPPITKLLQEFDFVFIPTSNPDGYVYTWESDRLWRKNRQKTYLSFCRGLDLDRAFGFEWDGSSASGQSNPCSENYPGEKPFEAVETQRLAEWAKNETDNNGVKFVAFLDLHSYSQQILYPYSYSCASDPPSLENLEELGIGLAKAIRMTSREQYGVASACEGAVAAVGGKASRMETGGGSAIDWFYQELKTRYSYQIKLRDTGSYGFLLPKEQIIPTGEEAFSAVEYLGRFLMGNKGIERMNDAADDAGVSSNEILC
ncbi:putative metallocarboxypeptidase ecm14 [Lachnellula suecica]|uniref:Inactive metallocarboxypeptidase ECM14 n=1 Tax=Lachnellula suecica TaxID=602035 RepID=A0A8T9C2W5_9HELO|nr:putative metallocarboxypeptidase ecm14 [Lachnellula suecica]